MRISMRCSGKSEDTTTWLEYVASCKRGRPVLSRSRKSRDVKLFAAQPSACPHLPSLNVVDMAAHSIVIDDVVSEASPFLRRMRLDGFESAAVPFAEEHVHAWRRGPGDDMDVQCLINALKVRCRSQ